LTRVRYLIFDLDGTLIDSSDGVVDAVNYALTRTGQPMQEARRIKSYIGYPLEQAFADFTSLPYPELYRHFQERAVDSVVASAKPLDGADEALRELHRRGYQLAIATTKIRAHVEAIVSKFQWQSLIGVAIGGNDVPAVKPDPAMFRLAIEKLGARPEETLAIGDTENDVRAAQAVPVRVVAVASPYGGDEKVRSLSPDYVIDSVAELVELLVSRNL
jgi:2-phosphoglycolate phosphatase